MLLWKYPQLAYVFSFPLQAEFILHPGFTISARPVTNFGDKVFTLTLCGFLELTWTQWSCLLASRLIVESKLVRHEIYSAQPDDCLRDYGGFIRRSQRKEEQSAVFCAAFSTLPQMTGSSLTVSWLILSEATIWPFLYFCSETFFSTWHHTTSNQPPLMYLEDMHVFYLNANWVLLQWGTSIQTPPSGTLKWISAPQFSHLFSFFFFEAGQRQ